MKSLKQTLTIAVTAAVIAGCASAGNNFNSNNVAKIQKGITTEPDLIKMFGPPNQQGVNSETGVTLTWLYTQATVKGTTFIPIVGAFAGGVDTKNKTLTVWLDNSGKVAGYNYSGGQIGMDNMTQNDPSSTNTVVLKSPRAQNTP